MTNASFNPFREALRLLSMDSSPSKQSYICYVLDELAGEARAPWSQTLDCRAAKDAIQATLGPHFSLGGWIYQNQPHVLPTDGRIGAMQKVRKQWLEFLAAEYDKGGIDLACPELYLNIPLPFPQFEPVQAA